MGKWLGGNEVRKRVKKNGLETSAIRLATGTRDGQLIPSSSNGVSR